MRWGSFSAPIFFVCFFVFCFVCVCVCGCCFTIRILLPRKGEKCPPCVSKRLDLHLGPTSPGLIPFPLNHMVCRVLQECHKANHQSAPALRNPGNDGSLGWVSPVSPHVTHVHKTHTVHPPVREHAGQSPNLSLGGGNLPGNCNSPDNYYCPLEEKAYLSLTNGIPGPRFALRYPNCT